MKMKFEMGIEKRKHVLFTSLLVESFTNIFLARLLEINDHSTSISFGNTSNNLSFNQRINLLIDVGAIEPTNKSKFITFMEIRNQFMHNLEADTYENCYKLLKGKDKYILKIYPQDLETTVESQLEKATKELMDEILTISVGLYDKVKEKITNEIRFKLLEEMQPVLLKQIAKLAKKK